MRANVWMTGLMASGLLACGHIPGYYPDEPEGEATPVAAPAGPPAPYQTTRRGEDNQPDDGQGYADDDQGYADDGQGYADDGQAYEDEASDEEAPAYEPPAPRPPRYTPPPAWEPEPAARPVAPAPAPAPAEEAARGVKTIRLDADTYYLIDAERNLCFLRHKESMTAIDCARVNPTRDAAPARPEAPRPSDARPAAPTGDESARFEAAFTDIFCDRKRRDETSPEARIRARGLTVERYEAIEAARAADENAWFSLTAKAARVCPR